MDSSDLIREVSNDALDDETIHNFYRNTRRNDLKVSSLSPKPSTSTPSRFRSPKKLDSLTYQDIECSNTNESEYMIEHKSKFQQPFYQQTAFQKLSLRQQVQTLCSYHTHIARNITQHARKSLECVPLPTPISASVRCTTSLRKDVEGSEDEASNSVDPFDALLDIPPGEEYISRSGRVTKRKFYSETINDVKKSKIVDEEWKETKALPTTPKSASRAKNPETNSKNSQLRNLSKVNQEIISRSPLFRDKDRLAKIAEGVEQKTFKDKAEEQKIEVFQSTLNVDDDVIEDIHSDSSDSFRAVVEPPKLGPRGRKAAEPKTTQKATPRQRNQPQKKPPDLLKGEVASSSKKITKKMVKCPICDREFGTKEIEEHASSCGENIMPTRSHNSGPFHVSCPRCDEVILDDQERARHIKNCS